jgi:hypothetical protein
MEQHRIETRGIENKPVSEHETNSQAHSLSDSAQYNSRKSVPTVVR